LDSQRARTTRRQKIKPEPHPKHEDRTSPQSKLSPETCREEGLRAFIMMHDKDKNALKIDFPAQRNLNFQRKKGRNGSLMLVRISYHIFL
jgi:hypothetical protein